MKTTTKYVAFYMFAEATSSVAIERLRRLRAINSKVTFVPVVGVRQLLYLPSFFDGYMFGNMRALHLIGPVSHLINSVALYFPGFFNLTADINKTVAPFTRHNKLAQLQSRAIEEGIENLYADFTPMVLFNADYAIMNWYKTMGKKLDFDYLIFYESDIFTTKPLEEIYEKYTESYDACFNEYTKADSDWHWSNYPPKCSWATKRWLLKRGLPPVLFRCIFGGALVSRSVLERLSELNIDFANGPYCTAEMRLPTVITALGFRCGRFNFPFYRFRPMWSENEVYSNEAAGIFHPVKSLLSVEKEYAPRRVG
jgi:hypothetical protein